MVRSSTTVTVEIDRDRAVTYRLQALDLLEARADGTVDDLLGLGALDVGLQDTPPGSARLSLALRLGAGLDPFSDDRVAMAWSTRGSPHVHRLADLPTLADALWPLSDRDAVNRLISGGKALASSDIAPLDGFAIAVAGMAEVVTGPMTKPEASAALTEHLPDELSGFCEPCGSVHVYEMVFRSAALPAGIGLVPGPRPLTLAPIAGWSGSTPDPGATSDLLNAFLALAGPASVGRGRGLPRLDPSRDRSGGVWPDGLVDVVVDGRPAGSPRTSSTSCSPSNPPICAGQVQLVAPGDPLLKGGDRELLVPDPARRKQLWLALNSPGAVLVGTDVVGTWKATGSGRTVTFTVTPFAKFPAGVRQDARASSRGGRRRPWRGGRRRGLTPDLIGSGRAAPIRHGPGSG